MTCGCYLPSTGRQRGSFGSTVGPMTQQWDAASSSGNALEDLARLAAQYEVQSSACDDIVLRRKNSLREATEEQIRVHGLLGEIRTVFESLTGATALAGRLLAAYPPESPNQRLHTAQDTPAEPLRQPDPPPFTAERKYEGNLDSVGLSPRVKDLVDLLSTRPGVEWTSMDVASLRGLAEEDKLGRKRLRNTLRDAVAKGLLERVVHHGGRRVYYRVVAYRRHV